MNITELQAFIDTKPDLREIINEIADYLQANPGGSGGFPAQLDGPTTVDLNGKEISFQQDGTDMLRVDPASGRSMIATSFDLDSGNEAHVLARSQNTQAYLEMQASFNGAQKVVLIKGYANGTESEIDYTADIHKFTGVINLPVQAAPGSPNDGDVWRQDNTNTGLKIRINGVTKTINVS